MNKHASGLEFLKAMDECLNLGGRIRSIEIKAHVSGIALLKVERLVDVDNIPQFITERFELMSLGSVGSEFED